MHQNCIKMRIVYLIHKHDQKNATDAHRALHSFYNANNQHSRQTYFILIGKIIVDIIKL